MRRQAQKPEIQFIFGYISAAPDKKGSFAPNSFGDIGDFDPIFIAVFGFADLFI